MFLAYPVPIGCSTSLGYLHGAAELRGSFVFNMLCTPVRHLTQLRHLCSTALNLKGLSTPGVLLADSGPAITRATMSVGCQWVSGQFSRTND